MRDNFSSKTKDILAKRVAFRCSFPGCGKITIGSGHESSSDVVNLGEAAHIHAASPNGPRFYPSMSSKERASIDNGIWMCRHHARIIDSDFTNYSAETIRQWKEIAEKHNFSLLESLESDLITIPTTLISLGSNIVFDGVWKSANDDSWKFIINNFIIGSIEDIKNFNDDITFISQRYIVIESQGDGRYINGNLNWELDNSKYIISLRPQEKSPRTTPYGMCDLPMNLEIIDGDLKLVKGEECAKQTIIIALSIDFGELFYAPTLGSYTSYYYWKYKDKVNLLTRLLKLEITRLISIPHKDTISGTETPPLNFINRILDIEILKIDLEKDRLPIKLKLEWGDGKIWEDTIDIFIKPKDKYI